MRRAWDGKRFNRVVSRFYSSRKEVRYLQQRAFSGACRIMWALEGCLYGNYFRWCRKISKSALYERLRNDTGIDVWHENGFFEINKLNLPIYKRYAMKDEVFEMAIEEVKNRQMELIMKMPLGEAVFLESIRAGATPEEALLAIPGLVPEDKRKDNEFLKREATRMERRTSALFLTSATMVTKAHKAANKIMDDYLSGKEESPIYALKIVENVQDRIDPKPSKAKIIVEGNKTVNVNVANRVEQAFKALNKTNIIDAVLSERSDG